MSEMKGKEGAVALEKGKNKKNVENELGRFMEPNSKCSYTSNNPQ
jgi:hypothetical protein